ncbi:MAG: GNAT family N-acetyltransferase [Microbacteriaceae bacterium]
MTSELTVVDKPSQSRFVLLRGTEELGEAVYSRNGDAIEFTHTQIDEHKREQGMGSTLVRAALDQVAATPSVVVASCPFVAEFIEENPEYQRLLKARD